MFSSIRRSAIALSAALTLLVLVLSLALAGGASPAPGTAQAGAPPTPTPCLTPGAIPIPTGIGGGCAGPFPLPTPAPPPPTPDLCGGCKMSLEVQGTLDGSAVTCDSKTGTVQNPAKCMLEQGSSFVVKIVANSIPPAGYSAWQTFLAYGGLMYKPTTDVADEIVWPDSAFPLRVPSSPSGTEGNVKHGALNSLGPPPIPISTQVGSLVELQMNCQGSDRLVLLPLVPLRSFLVNLDAKLHSRPAPLSPSPSPPKGSSISTSTTMACSITTAN